MSTIEFLHARPGRRARADATRSPPIRERAKPMLREVAGAVAVIGFFGTLVMIGLLFRLWLALPEGTLGHLVDGS
jgi:hypothetical protein